MKLSYISAALASVIAFAGCADAFKELEDAPHQARPAKDVITVTVNASIDMTGRTEAEAAMGDDASRLADLWQWTEGDVAYAVYESDGMTDICRSKSITVNSSDPADAVITFDRIPYDAVVKAIEVGGNSAFGQKAASGEKLSKKMAYLRGETEAEAGQTSIDDVILINKCCYLGLNLEQVSFYGIGFETRKVVLSGEGLCGHKEEDVINIRYSSEADGEQYIVAVSREARNLSVTADFAEGEKHIAEMESLENAAIKINDIPDDTPRMSVTADIILDAASKAACTDAELAAAAPELWTLKNDDKVYAAVEIHGYHGNIPCDIVEPDASDPGKAKVTFNGIPVESVINGIGLGTASAFGKSTFTGNGITRDMIYAFSEVDSSVGTSDLGEVELKHRCSYLNIMADRLSMDGQEYAVTGLSVSGADIKADGMPLIMQLASEEGSSSYWVSVSNSSRLLSVVASYDNTAAMIYSADNLPGTSELLKVRADSPQKAEFRTVLFSDGTFIINQLSAFSTMDKAMYGEEVKSYPPMDGENSYVFIDQNSPYEYLEGEEIPEDERDLRVIIDDLRNIEDVDAYFIVKYGEEEGKKKTSTLWEEEKSLIRSVKFGSTVQPQSMNVWFRGCTNLTSIDVTGLDLSKCTGLWGTFKGCSSLASIDVSAWNLSKAETVSQIFDSCTSLTTLDVSRWQTGTVRSFSRMFEGCERITRLDVASWDMSGAKTIRYMFSKCKTLNNIDVSNWNVSNVGNFVGIFDSCSSLEHIDVSGWDTSSAYNSFFGMFRDCAVLQELDLSGWDVRNIKEMDNLFSRCNSIRTIDLSGWDISSLEKCGNMFRQCFALETVYTEASFDVTTLFFSKTKGMFFMCSSLTGGLGTKIPEAKLHADVNPECSGRHFGRVDMIDSEGNHLPGVFTLKK